MTFDELTSVHISNAIGLLLMLTLLLSNTTKMKDNRDFRYILRLILIVATSCVVDSIAYIVDGCPGSAATVVIYATNSWLYLANILMGRFWVDFTANHLNVWLSVRHRRVLNAISGFGMACLMINLLYPLVFTVEANVYRRTYLYWIYLLIAVIFILDSVALYFRAKKIGGALKVFPVGVMIFPVVVGTTVQSVCYGVAMIWVSVAVAIAGVMSALKNEMIFIDKLTGLYNRAYLDALQGTINQRKEDFITGVMIDLNGFKTINDRFGHGTGDEALKIVSNIFRMTVGDLGSVIRYAGDEFVILLNTVEEQKVVEMLDRLKTALEQYNETGGKPYRLSAAMGYAMLDLNNQTMNDFMNTIDRKMYEDKAAYDKSEPGANH